MSDQDPIVQTETPTERPRKPVSLFGWVLSVLAVIALVASGWYAWSAYDRVRRSEAELAREIIAAERERLAGAGSAVPDEAVNLPRPAD